QESKVTSNPFARLEKKDRSRKQEASSSKKSALDEIMIEEARRKRKRNDHWLHPGIVVKVITKNAGEQYYKQKGVVEEVVDRYGALVRLIESGVKLKLDQVHCETVIPSAGRKVKIVNGPYNGQEATLQDIDVDRYCATLKLKTGVVEKGVEHEDFSKLSA
ncbi:DNA/RNA-binding protein KIN17-like, partial [Galendromus occidentalis]|uniref:DNA/RNA-binding protein KIN17-like n=1 Tax=Galendromus occidentalis TaxID=34638 RepID=A0AAJ6VVM9_9ACAR